MKAVEIFDVCHARYRGLREWLDDSAGAVRSVDLGKPSEGYHWRPGRARACEYVADFERIGRHALRRAEWKGRLKLFNIYFVHSVEYRSAISLVEVAEGTFDYWFREIKRALGAEFSRTNLYPPTRYFLDVRGDRPNALDEHDLWSDRDARHKRHLNHGRESSQSVGAAHASGITAGRAPLRRAG
jgi:hypothetical protein